MDPKPIFGVVGFLASLLLAVDAVAFLLVQETPGTETVTGIEKESASEIERFVRARSRIEGAMMIGRTGLAAIVNLARRIEEGMCGFM